MRKIRFGLALFIFACFSITAFAHKPYIPEGNETIITDPEISKAFYSKLDGEEQVYTITSDTSFLLYVNILVPDLPDQKRDFSLKIVKDGDSDNPLALLSGENFEWKKFFEPFGHDTYLMGPEYESKVEAGEYQIIVSSEDNDSKYSLATGKIESFSFKDTLNALTLIPKNKREFFDKSPVDFILSPFGWGLILIMFVMAFVFGFVYRLVLRKLAKGNIRKRNQNIGWKDRLIRFALALILFIIAITTTWSPLLLFFSGFTLFEALFSWCGFYAAIGRNTCPL